MCNCKKEFEEKISEHIKKTLPEGYEGFGGNLKGYGLGINTETNSFVLRFQIPFEGLVMVPRKAGGLKKKPIKTFVVALFCPFCGKPCNNGGE